MSLSRSRLVAVSLVTVGVGAAVALGNALPQWRSVLSPVPGAIGETAPERKKAPDAGVADERDKQEEANQARRGVQVEAPHTEVNVDKASGKVTVKAPHTDVRVDTEKGRVQVRAPYVNLDIRW